MSNVNVAKNLRIIAHLDMDAFFAAIEERDNPRWRGFPIVIGSDPAEGRGRGVVSTASYKAREYGIKSALPISKAWQFSETARLTGKQATIFLPPDFKKYSRVSREIFAILEKHSPLVEPSSIDEAYFDLTQTDTFNKAAAVARKIKAEIKKKEKLTCSIGIGPNKLVAKIASDFKKPDGLTIVGLSSPSPARGRVGVRVNYFDSPEDFLAPLPIRKIPGIGPKTEIMLNKLNIKIVSDLKKYSEPDLHEMLGKWGLELYEKIRGLDDSPLVQNYEAKSIGEQETFLHDTLEAGFIFDRLEAMAKNILAQLKNEGFKNFKTIALTVRFSGFETKTRSRTLDEPTDSLNILRFEGIKLLSPFLDSRQNPQKKLIRLIGLRVEKLN